MRIVEGYTVLDVLTAGRDAGWVVAMIMICVTTFAVSSVFAKRGSFAGDVWRFVRHARSAT
jgi:hypothetical protein